MARELRAGPGADLRADAEEGERLAAQAALRRRGLADVASEVAARGGTLTVLCRDRRFVGTVRHAARDLLTLETVGGTVHVNLAGPVTLRGGPADESPVATWPGPSPDDAPSFKARLYELELAGSDVELGVATEPGELRGRLRAVALDHVLLDGPDGARSAVALRAIAWLRVRPGG